MLNTNKCSGTLRHITENWALLGPKWRIRWRKRMGMEWKWRNPSNTASITPKRYTVPPLLFLHEIIWSRAKKLDDVAHRGFGAYDQMQGQAMNLHEGVMSKIKRGGEMLNQMRMVEPPTLYKWYLMLLSVPLSLRLQGCSRRCFQKRSVIIQTKRANVTGRVRIWIDSFWTIKRK